jgi:hypothetical protein
MNTEQRAREILAEELSRMGLFASADHIRKNGPWTMDNTAAVRAIERAIEEGRALSQPASAGEGVYAPRYVADGPEGMFGTDDLEFAGKLIARGAADQARASLGRLLGEEGK